MFKTVARIKNLSAFPYYNATSIANATFITNTNNPSITLD